jgi:hypothetical protein
MVVDAGGGTMEILLYRKTAQGWDQCSSSSGMFLAVSCTNRDLVNAVQPKHVGAILSTKLFATSPQESSTDTLHTSSKFPVRRPSKA